MLDKVKLVQHPEDFDKDNLNYKANVRIRIPMVSEDHDEEKEEGEKDEEAEEENEGEGEEEVKEEEKVEEKKETEPTEEEAEEKKGTPSKPKKMIEDRLEDKVLLINPNQNGERIYVTHQYANRLFRADLAAAIKKQNAGFDEVDLDVITEKIEGLAEKMEQWWFDHTGLPTFDFEIN